MDPNAALQRIRDAATRYGAALTDDDAVAAADDALNAFDDLDKWLCASGFLPEDWDQ